jgi:uncharacterized protein (DUF934 family)
MKKCGIVFLSLALMAFAVYNVFDELNITEDKAKEYLLNSIASGMMSSDSEVKDKARNLSTEGKVQVIRDLIKYAREYSQTEEFKSDYKKWRKNKLNPDQKTKLGLPKFGKILDNKVNNSMDKAENEKRYPSDPNDLIKQRLTDFLKVSATVDFDAELDGREFKKAEYQRKSADWKYCFRAGTEVVAAAREEAQKWLDELK